MRERRRHERVPFLAKARLRLGPQGPEWQARSLDLSDGGVCLFAPAMLEVSARVEISLRLRGEEETVWSEPQAATVRRCQVEPEGNRIAFEFDSLISDSGDPRLAQALARALAFETRAA